MFGFHINQLINSSIQTDFKNQQHITSNLLIKISLYAFICIFIIGLGIAENQYPCLNI